MKKEIINTVKDLVSDFLYYDRKEDEELSHEQLNEAIKTGVITIDEIVSIFREELENCYNY